MFFGKSADLFWGLTALWHAPSFSKAKSMKPIP